VAAFCGIGNPAGFRHTLNQCRFRVAALREFPDHHPYHRDDVDSLTSWLAGLDVDAVLCTHKDLVKLQVSRLGGRPLWAVGIGVDFLGGREALETRLSTLPIPPD
jgi:tetraacyldisaccharide 4'-kinase